MEHSECGTDKNLLRDMRNARLSKAGSGTKGHVLPSRPTTHASDALDHLFIAPER